MELVLRKVREGDLERIRVWRTSEEVSRHLYTDPVLTPEDQRAWYGWTAQDPSCRYWILEVDHAAVGLVYLTDINARHSRCAWGYYIADPSMRGRGLGKAVELNVQRYVFAVLGLHKLCCEVLATNQTVVEIHRKYGSRIEGSRREHVFKRGTFHDIVEMAILREEWVALESAREPYLSARIEG